MESYPLPAKLSSPCIKTYIIYVFREKLKGLQNAEDGKRRWDSPTNIKRQSLKVFGDERGEALYRSTRSKIDVRLVLKVEELGRF
jgi:hypothetical protein